MPGQRRRGIVKGSFVPAPEGPDDAVESVRTDLPTLYAFRMRNGSAAS
jgi:hypothetical protein